METIDIRLLSPHPYNQKIYGTEDVTELAERIKKSAWIKPLVVTPNNRIISGHRRWQAAVSLAYTSLPVERRTFENETDELEALLLENASREKTIEQKVREAECWQSIEKEKSKAQRLATLKHNSVVLENFPERQRGDTRDKVAEKVGFGSGRTYEKASAVVSTADKMIAKGDTKEGRELLTTLNEKSVHKAYQEVKKHEKREEVAHLIRFDATPIIETPKRVVEHGQVWQLGDHLVYCGDSSSQTFTHLCATSFASFAFADPPYNAGVAEWDTNFLWSHDYLMDIAPIVAVTPGIASIQSFLRTTSLPYKWSMSYWLNNGMTRSALGFGNWIYVALFSHESLYRNAQDFEQVSINSADRDDLEHKGRKPLAMMLHLVKLFTEEGQTVIDPFLGTGTTLAACEQTKRQCIGCELSPEYVEALIKRWENLTGKEAHLDNTLLAA